MTSVTSRVETVERHIWTIPCSYSPGKDGYTSVIGDMHDAYSMMASAAKSMGIKTDSDDWAHIRPSDENVELFFDVERNKRSPESLEQRLRAAADLLDELEMQGGSKVFNGFTAVELRRLADDRAAKR